MAANLDDPFAPLGLDERNHADAPFRDGDPWQPILPVPQDAPGLSKRVAERFAPDGYGFTCGWRYYDENCHFLGAVARYDRPANGKPADKQVLPITYCQGPRGRRDWRCKSFPPPRPLYHLDHLAGRPGSPVLVVEGEKTADAAAVRFPAYVVMTSPGGSKAARKADWKPLAGRAVAIWPDADEPGKRYAQDVADMLRQAGAASVSVVALPPGLPVAWDLADELPTALRDADLVRLLAEARPSDSDESDPWSHPDTSLLGTGRRPAPGFPTDLLGPFWSAWAARQAQEASAPVDYVALSLLASVGASLANVRWPVAGAGWSEPPVLWAALVGSPSSGKSPSMDAAFDLVRHAEDLMASGFDHTRRDYETKKQAAEERRDIWKGEVKAALKAGGGAPPKPLDADEPEAPVRPRIRVADVTTEKLGALAAALTRGLLLVRDEMSGWLGGFDRYGGGGADRSFAIEMYGGRPYVIDRMKNAEPLRIRHLSIGVLGGVQPDKIPGIIDGPDDGLASRLLWTWPEPVQGFTLPRQVVDDRDARHAFMRLVDLQAGTDDLGHPTPKRLRLSETAEDQLEAFASEMKQRAEEASGMFAGTLGKARGHVLRLSLALEYLWWSGEASRPEPAAITEKAVVAAAGLVDGYFVPMAERVYGDAAIPVSERGAMALARHLRKVGLVEFNARELRREIGGRLREAAAMEGACKLLVEAGLVRPRFTRAGERGGRKASNYEVNPAVQRGLR
jgi:hypothetical protein